MKFCKLVIQCNQTACVSSSIEAGSFRVSAKYGIHRANATSLAGDTHLPQAPGRHVDGSREEAAGGSRHRPACPGPQGGRHRPQQEAEDRSGQRLRRGTDAGRGPHLHLPAGAKGLGFKEE